MEDDLKKKKMEDDQKNTTKNRFAIPIKYGRKPQKDKKWKTTSKKK